MNPTPFGVSPGSARRHCNWLRADGRPLRIGHKGAAALEPENMLRSLRRAGSLRELAAIEPGLARGYTYPLDRHGVSQRRLLAPVTATALLGLRRTLPLRIGGMLERAPASAAMLHHWVVSRAVVERAHERGAAVFAWTVDDVRSLERVLGAGVDGVITNDPRILATTLMKE